RYTTFHFSTFTNPAPSTILPLSLHDALPIYLPSTKDFYMKVTTAWEPQEERSSRDAGWLRRAVETTGRKLLFQSSQTDISLFELDRKSTRLNSSHLGISYAVFCLKKKKINQI